MNWNTFLEESPVLVSARKYLDEENFLRFLQGLYKIPTPKEFKHALVCHAFEEVGWPEGESYCYQTSSSYILTMIRSQPLKEKIATRLANRQARWKTKKQEHIAAHIQLFALLPANAQNCECLQGLMP